MARFAEVVTQTFRNLTPDAVSERLFGESQEKWWQERTEQLEKTDYPGGPVQTSFFLSTFTALGSLARVDGRVNETEIDTAQRIMVHLNLNAEQRKLAIRLFNEGKQADFNVESIIARFYRQVRHRVSVCQIFMEIMFQMASADGHVNDLERAKLNKMAQYLDISQAIVKRIEDRVVRRQPDWEERQQQRESQSVADMTLTQAYKLFGVSRWTDKENIKQTYRRLVSKYHPDKLMANGSDHEEVNEATRKLQAFHHAFGLISKARRIS